jgi:hypothetical protein
MATSNLSQLSPAILLLSDSDPLARLIQVMLQNRWRIQTHRIDQPELVAPEVDSGIKLVILALSQAAYEPVVVLRRTNVLRLVGEIPLIIISLTVRGFEHWPDDRVWHMDFPPDWSRLSQTVSEIVSESDRQKRKPSREHGSNPNRRR